MAANYQGWTSRSIDAAGLAVSAGFTANYPGWTERQCCELPWLDQWGVGCKPQPKYRFVRPLKQWQRYTTAAPARQWLRISAARTVSTISANFNHWVGATMAATNRDWCTSAAMAVNYRGWSSAAMDTNATAAPARQWMQISVNIFKYIHTYIHTYIHMIRYEHFYVNTSIIYRDIYK